MATAGLRPILSDAMENGYGVLAINILDDLTLRSVIVAAEACSSPVIVQTSVKTVRALGVQQIYSMFEHAASQASVPVALHLDHCPDRRLISECIRAGWNSVLFDGSTLTLDEVTSQTKEVVAEAHEHGVHVEGEIEGIQGVEDGIGSDESPYVYPLDMATEFIETTGIDCFAPALGNAHGVYHSVPKIDSQRVSDLVEATGVPMALHGGSGLSAEQFTDLINRGCAKVNISTALKHTYIDAHREFLTMNPHNYDPPSLLRHVDARVRECAIEYMELFGSGGTAR